MRADTMNRLVALVWVGVLTCAAGLAREASAVCISSTGTVFFSIPERDATHPANGAFYLHTFPSPDLVEIEGVGALTLGALTTQYLAPPLEPSRTYSLRVWMEGTLVEIPFTTTDVVEGAAHAVPVITAHTIGEPLDAEPPLLCQQISNSLDCYDTGTTSVTTTYEAESPYVVVSREGGRGAFVWPTSCGPVFEKVTGELFEGGPSIRACYTLEAMAHDGTRSAPSVRSCGERSIPAPSDDDDGLSCATFGSRQNLSVVVVVLFAVRRCRRRRRCASLALMPSSSHAQT